MVFKDNILSFKMLSCTLPTNKLLNKMKGRLRQPFLSLLGMKTKESWNHRICSVTNAANDRHQRQLISPISQLIAFTPVCHIIFQIHVSLFPFPHQVIILLELYFL